MQYTLTKEEYKQLQKLIVAEKLELQELCTLVARHAPTDRPWSDSKEPWGCIRDGVTKYCDRCPARNLCPHPDKNFSK
jgi:hypothetical protein